MTLFCGLDIGTSGVKAVLLDADDAAHAEAAEPIAVSAPRPGWSEQHPDLWWDATVAVLDRLAAGHPDLCRRVGGIGLSGQMLGAVLLDAADRPVRPAILWNDRRAIAESAALLARVPDIGRRTNGAPDPGLTAPKLLWLATHEPAALEAARWLMLPKDYVRLRLTGERLTEPTDAGGTMLLDVATGRWDAALCAAAGWDVARLPPLVASWSAAGGLRPELAARWGMRPGLPVAAGAGDNMACTLGVGAARPGEAVTTLGTSAVLCAVDGAFRPGPEVAVLTSAHAAPAAFLSMGVVMSATAALDWLARLSGLTVPALAAEIDAFAAGGDISAAPSVFPAFAGVRTPGNRPDATATVAHLTQETPRGALGYALLEGLSFQLLDCLRAQQALGVPVERMSLVGGGARNRLWARMIAALFGIALEMPRNAPLAACTGAARLAAVAAGAGEASAWLSRSVPVARTVAPEPDLAALLERRRPGYEMLRDTAQAAR